MELLKLDIIQDVEKSQKDKFELVERVTLPLTRNAQSLEISIIKLRESGIHLEQTMI